MNQSDLGANDRYIVRTTALSPFFHTVTREDGLVQRMGSGTFDPARGLFQIFVVDPEKGEVVKDELVVADSAEKAKLKVLRTMDVDPDDVDILITQHGYVREKVKPQVVQIVEASAQGSSRPSKKE